MASQLILTQILSELKSLRTDINQRRNQENLSRPQSTATKAQQFKETPARKLLADIANRPLANTICWYHRKFGISANPLNCPGKPTCIFNLEQEIKKMQTQIDRVSKPKKNAAQDRLINIKSSHQNCPTTATTKNPPIVKITPMEVEPRRYSPATPPRNIEVRQYSPATPLRNDETPPNNWSEELEAAIDGTISNPPDFEPLDDQIDLSDSE